MPLSAETSLFKFSQITRNDFNPGAALFTLENMGKLAPKDRDVILNFIVEICSAYLKEHGIDPPKPDWTPADMGLRQRKPPIGYFWGG
jgi:hypothetical protein